MFEPVAASLPLWPEVRSESSHPDSTACRAVCPVQILLYVRGCGRSAKLPSHLAHPSRKAQSQV